MHSLLVVDDDYGLFSLLAEYLETEGFAAVHAADAESALAKFRECSWDAVILDVMLPGKNGFEILRLVRSDPNIAHCPILMLTARDEEEDKVSGLELGADDYLTKPFGTRELVARLRALLRRASNTDVLPGMRKEDDLIRLGDVTVNRKALELSINDMAVAISAMELRLLEAFAELPGKVVARKDLYQKVFGHSPFYQDRSLDMLVSRLRRKLGARSGGERIRAARGEGYVFLLTEDE